MNVVISKRGWKPFSKKNYQPNTMHGYSSDKGAEPSNDGKTSQEDDSVTLPNPPEKPLDSDCCGNGCVPCVMDVYQEEVGVWEAECSRLREGRPQETSALLDEVQPLRKDQYSSYTIEHIFQETPDTKRIKCKLGLEQKLGLSIGQHIVIRCKKPNGMFITRQYTPISNVSTTGYFELAIKIYENGQMSQLIQTWSVGDEIQARGPLGNLSYSRNKYDCLLMLCAGTGVAPMCQVIGSVLGDDLEDTRLRLIYASRTYTQLMAKHELDEWTHFWNFSVTFILSQEPDPAPQNYRYGESVVRGHIDKDLIMSELNNCPQNTCVLVCGTPSFEADVLRALKNLDVEKDLIHKF